MHPRSTGDSRDRTKTVERLTEVVKGVVDGLKPEEVVLFGSYARGEEREQSSLDLLIVAQTDLPFIERIKRVIELVSEDTIPVEPLVYTPEELKEKLEEADSFIVSAMSEGVLMYSKHEDLNIEDQLEKKKKESEFKDLLMEVD